MCRPVIQYRNMLVNKSIHPTGFGGEEKDDVDWSPSGFSGDTVMLLQLYTHNSAVSV